MPIFLLIGCIRRFQTQGAQRYQDFLSGVAKAQAQLIAKWMSFGFIHGVMNTDNASIAGETIDYGPCAFMDTFDPGKVFSSIDHQGRYAWNRQAEIGHWNLTKLVHAVLPILGDTQDAQMEAAQAALAEYVTEFRAVFQSTMAHKLGLSAELETLPAFINETVGAMANGGVDFTQFFTQLTRHSAGGPDVDVLSAFQSKTVAATWLEAWQAFRQERRRNL